MLRSFLLKKRFSLIPILLIICVFVCIIFYINTYYDKRIQISYRKGYSYAIMCNEFFPETSDEAQKINQCMNKMMHSIDK